MCSPAHGMIQYPYPAGLVAREVQLLQSLADGEELKVAAGKMGLTYGAAKNVLHRVYDKIGFDTQASAVAWGFRKKILV